MANDDFKEIVRLGNSDIEGHNETYSGLTSIKGVDWMFSNAICKVLDLDKKKKIGELSEDKLAEIQDLLKNPSKFDVPEWLYNRRKDLVDGKDKHLVGKDIKLKYDFDIKRLSKIVSYRGQRLSRGLPVRGQRTKSNFRDKSVSLKINKSRNRGA